jgi:pyridoxamine 5'-phosphate oxidase
VELTDCLAFAIAHPVCYLATEDGDQPRVRALPLWFADERGFYFTTVSPEALSRQLHANPRVEICFSNGFAELEDARMMRVSGEVEFLDDEGLTRRASTEGSPLEAIIGEPLEPQATQAEVFRLPTGRASFWGPGDVLLGSEAQQVPSTRA